MQDIKKNLQTFLTTLAFKAFQFLLNFLIVERKTLFQDNEIYEL